MPPPLTSDMHLTSNLDCSTNSFTLEGATLNGNGFTITLGENTINLQNGAKLEDVELVSTGNLVSGTGTAVTVLEGGGGGGECEHQGYAHHMPVNSRH